MELLFRIRPEPTTLKTALEALRQAETRLSVILTWIKGFHGQFPDSLRTELKCTDDDFIGGGGGASVRNVASTSQSENGVMPRSNLPRKGHPLSQQHSRPKRIPIAIASPPRSPESSDHDHNNGEGLCEANSPSPYPNLPSQKSLPYSYGVNVKLELGDNLIFTRHGPIKIVDNPTITNAANHVFGEGLKHETIPIQLQLFHCQHCPAKFESVAALSVHSLTHTLLRLWRLDISQQSLKLLQSHGHRYCIRALDDNNMTVVRRTPAAPLRFLRRKAVHIVKEREQCEFCSRSFTSEIRLTNHLKKVHKRPRACKICEIPFSTFRERTAHIRAQHPDLVCHKCDVCDKSFLSKDDLWHHVTFSHPDPTKATTCEFCGKLCKTERMLKEHLRMRHSDPNQAVTCPTCGGQYRSTSLLRRHMRTHAPRSFLCQTCGYAAKSNQRLLTHIKNVHVADRPFKCPHCPQAFKRSHALELHVDRHLGKNTKTCPHCGVEKSGYDLNLHIKVVHRGRKFKCKHCPGMYSIRAHLKQHYILKHPDVAIPPDEEIEAVFTKTPEATITPLPSPTSKIFKESSSSRPCPELSCATCPEAVFYSRESWAMHMVRHDKDPDYKLQTRVPVQRLGRTEDVTEQSAQSALDHADPAPDHQHQTVTQFMSQPGGSVNLGQQNHLFNLFPQFQPQSSEPGYNAFSTFFPHLSHNS